jgi:hypothetical protein
MPIAFASPAARLFLVFNHGCLPRQQSGQLPPNNLIYLFFRDMIAQQLQPIRVLLVR